MRTFGSLTVDPLAREVVLDGTTLELTRIEFDLLDTFTAEPRVAFSRAQLLERVWGPNWFGDDHLVDVHVSNLRRKLADDPRSPDFVCTVRGVGYRMGAGPVIAAHIPLPPSLEDGIIVFDPAQRDRRRQRGVRRR